MNQTITTNGGDVMIVECPMDAHDFGWRFGLFSYATPETEQSKTETYKTISEVDDFIHTLSKKNKVELLGCITNGEMDFDCSNLVEKHGMEITWYLDYEIEGGGYADNSLSFLSLLRSKSIVVDGKRLVILKILK